MRTKLFFAFLAVLLTALISNFIFEDLIISDFEDYMLGMEQDHLYWILAPVEGAYSQNGWDLEALAHYLQIGTIIGYDIEVRTPEGELVLDTHSALQNTSAALLRRINAIVYADMPQGEFEELPLFVEGQEVGVLGARRLATRGHLKMKVSMFKQRGRTFLLISFFIAGGGALLLSFIFSVFLTRPIRKLTSAAERIAEGDLSARVTAKQGDEIGMLIGSFNRMAETLDREETLRRHLTSNIAHELRTPLTIMRSNLEAVADGVVAADERTINNLLNENNRLINLVRGIEDITRAEASFFKPSQYEPVELGEFLGSLVEILSPAFAEKGLTLNLEQEQELPVSTDVEKLDIVIRNIVTNALKYTEHGGVTLRYGPTESGYFISVRDTGRGMTPELAAQVFHRFFRSEDSTGIGLGLAIAQELIGIMGGRIEVQSEPGAGSTFTVHLPEYAGG